MSNTPNTLGCHPHAAEPLRGKVGGWAGGEEEGWGEAPP